MFCSIYDLYLYYYYYFYSINKFVSISKLIINSSYLHGNMIFQLKNNKIE